VEDKLLEGATLDAAIQKFDPEVLVVGLSWLSSCIEQKKRVSEAPFLLRRMSKGAKGQNKRSLHDLSSSDESDPEERVKSKQQPRDFAGKSKHSLSDSDEEEDTANKDIVEKNISPEEHEQEHEHEQGKELGQSSAPPNGHIAAELGKLAKAYSASGDQWRARTYSRAVKTISALDTPITTREQAVALPGIGKALADKIMEMLENGRIRKVDEVCSSEKVKVLSLFSDVWGAGPKTAQAWWDRGFRSLDDLKGAGLTRQQEIGLRLYSDLNSRMAREEAGQLASLVQEEAERLVSGVEVTACGSYRRGRKTCGDLDLLITHPDNRQEGLLPPLLSALHAKGILTDDLTVPGEGGSHQKKYMGVARLPDSNALHRRLDIILVPWRERGAAKLYFTGSAEFNRSMRQIAVDQGCSLSEHGLRLGVLRVEGGKKMGELSPAETEEEIFEELGLPYKHPEDRETPLR